MKRVAIIVAGGAGLRLGGAVPKQFLPLSGKAILYHTASAFTKAVPGISLIVALPESYYDLGQKILREAGIEAACVTGGIERYHSVKNALQVLDGEEGLVAVHDAARPFVSMGLIRKCFEEAAIHGCAIPFVPVKDSMRILENDAWVPAARILLRAVQTPQVFDIQKLKKAFKALYLLDFTDDAAVYEKDANRLHFTGGEEHNFKITTALDYEIAKYLADKENLRPK